MSTQKKGKIILGVKENCILIMISYLPAVVFGSRIGLTSILFYYALGMGIVLNFALMLPYLINMKKKVPKDQENKP